MKKMSTFQKVLRILIIVIGTILAIAILIFAVRGICAVVAPQTAITTTTDATVAENTTTTKCCTCGGHCEKCGTFVDVPNEGTEGTQQKIWFCCSECPKYLEWAKSSSINIYVNGDGNNIGDVQSQSIVVFGDFAGAAGVGGDTAGAGLQGDNSKQDGLIGAGDGQQNSGDNNNMINEPQDIDVNGDENAAGKNAVVGDENRQDYVEEDAAGEQIQQDGIAGDKNRVTQAATMEKIEVPETTSRVTGTTIPIVTSDRPVYTTTTTPPTTTVVQTTTVSPTTTAPTSTTNKSTTTTVVQTTTTTTPTTTTTESTTTTAKGNSVFEVPSEGGTEGNSFYVDLTLDNGESIDISQLGTDGCTVVAIHDGGNGCYIVECIPTSGGTATVSYSGNDSTNGCTATVNIN